jgi:hypothetical protein
MARGALTFYIDSGTPAAVFVPSAGVTTDEITNAQAFDFVFSKENGKTWQKKTDLTWAEISTGRPKNATDDVTLSSDHIINNVSPIRGAHIQDFNKMLKALQTISANRYGDRYFNDHDKTEARSIWFMSGLTQAELKKVENTNLKLVLSDVTNKFIIGGPNGPLDVFTILNSQLYRVNVNTDIMDALHVFADSIVADVPVTANMQVISTVATGTAPLVIASTTKVANLNADLLDDMTTGNAEGNIPINNNTMSVGLNADKLDGVHLQELLDMIPQFHWNGTGYFDTGAALIGSAISIQFPGIGVKYFPTSDKASGTCHGNCHSKCNWFS